MAAFIPLHAYFFFRKFSLTKQVEIVQIDVPVPVKTDNPWLEKFGWFHDDPTFEDLQQEIAAYRRELDNAVLFS